MGLRDFFGGRRSQTPARRPDIFSEFQDLRRIAPMHFEVNFLGGLTRSDFRAIRTADADPPRQSEEYFQWASILEAAKAAGDCFTFVELGAGYGGWSANAALAARRLGKKYRLLMVEAEPQHLAWIPQNMADNDICEKNYKIMPYAVGESGVIPFYIQGPSELGASNAHDWYGQSAVHREYREQLTPSDQTYFGRPVKNLSNGFNSIEVESRPLVGMIEHLDHIDLIDMDIQGAEAEVVEDAIDVLDGKAKRMHIETHTPEVEDRLRAVLAKHGWRILWDFPCATDNVPTPFGPVNFLGGLIDCVNPRLG